MKARYSFSSCLAGLVAGAALLALCAPGALAATATVHARTITAGKSPLSSPTNAVAEMDGKAIPQSFFNVPTTLREGRNPFFPESMQAKPTPKPIDRGIDATKLILNGITSPPKATAMINGRTFEEGESADVKLPDGTRVPIKVVEIKNGSAIIQLRGQTRELKLRSGF